MSDTQSLFLRDALGKVLVSLGKEASSLCLLTADLAESLRFSEFAHTFPERFIECGVAEQNMIGIAAGLALSGMRPVTGSYAVFSPGRTIDQIRLSIAYNNLPVIIIGSHTGLSVGADGATHQALEDIAIMRTLPNMAVVVPADVKELEEVLSAALEYQGPLYIRLHRTETPAVTTSHKPFALGKSNILTEGSDVTLCANGPMLSIAIDAWKEANKQGIKIEIINVSSVKPLDTLTILESVRKTNCLLTVEDAQIAGGMGSAVLECISESYPVVTHRMGVADEFGESGSPSELYQKHGLTSAEIVKQAIIIKQNKKLPC